MPKYIYLYGPDGSGKTAIALEIKKLYPDTILIPFEPTKLKKRDFDSGYMGRDSASKVYENHILKSFALFIRYIINDIMIFYLTGVSVLPPARRAYASERNKFPYRR